MNFFEHQERARGTTRKLVLLFIVAIVSLILVTTLLVIAAFELGTTRSGGTPGFYFPPGVLVGVSAVVLSVVALGAMFRLAQLRGGGKVVAEGLGGRLLNTGTRDANERKALNVVEEMAIAAGVAVPQVYLLEDPAINAFAAGYRAQDAVIGLTRGCIELLNRDELQGVIAHEFSHIFNGDMRLNIRLIGWLYGITVIGLIGLQLGRALSYGRIGRSRDNNNGGAIAALGLVMLGLMVAGSGGTFCGNLIKAAVSRQREFLADATAVEYTRNPLGIGGALKKIGGYSQGSQLKSANASEVSHMLFGQGFKHSFLGLFATHPPLPERIRRVEPNWNGDFIEPQRSAAPEEASAPPGAGHAATVVKATVLAGFAPAQAATVMARMGDPDTEHLASASAQLKFLPSAIEDAAHTTLGATLLAFGLLLVCADAATRQQQEAWLQRRFDAAAYRQLQTLLPELNALPRPLHLTLIDLTLPALRALSEAQLRTFLDDLHHCMLADGKLSLFEWCLFHILRDGLAQSRRAPLREQRIENLHQEVGVVLSALASAGQASEENASGAFNAAIALLQLTPAPSLQLRNYPDLKQLETAFTALRDLQASHKQNLLGAMVRCVEFDAQLTVEEHELLRAAAAMLDCPMPPLKLNESL